MARILIIDESNAAREALAEELMANGHEVVSVSKYFEAVDALEKSIRITDPQRRNFDLICLDRPADRSGFYMLLRIREQRILTSVKVIGARVFPENVWRDIDERNTHRNFQTTEKERRDGTSEYFWNSQRVQEIFPLPA